MSARLWFSAVIAAGSTLFLVPENAHAQSRGGEGYGAFRLLRSRNIFDPERRSMQSDAPQQPRSESRSSRSNFIALTGTMVTAGKTLAFFTGSQPDYNKVIGVGDSIADFKVTQIEPTHVDLTLGGKLINVTVGRQLPLEGSSAAGGVATIDAPPPPGSAPGAPPPTTAAPTSVAPTTDKNEMMRRMMERRQKEMSK
jgi:hypothetical protein